MKLRNKKTGEIIEAESCNNTGGCISIYYEEKDGQIGTKDCFNSLAELNEEWEDYEYPKEHYFITEYGGVFSLNEYEGLNNVANPEDYKQIGNYFGTKEEAEKAVEKLKAWKRLKDKGFKFIGVRGIGKVIDFDIPEPYNHVGFDEYVSSESEKEFFDDLMLLFGGEE